MSRVIKASRIKGEYQIKDKKIEKKNYSSEEVERKRLREENQIDENELDDEEREELKALKEKIITEAQEEAEEILQQAQQKADKIEEKSKKEADQLQKEAHEKGYNEGFAQGKQEAREELAAEFKNLMEDFEDIIKETKNSLDNNLELFQQQLIELSLKIAEKMVSAVLEIKPDLINNIIFDLLENMTEFEKINIHVNPEIEKYLVKEEFSTKFVRQNINFIADNNLKPGDCIVETPLGGKDASLENKLNLIEKELLKGVSFDEGA